jgi:hypothetical protein
MPPRDPILAYDGISRDDAGTAPGTAFCIPDLTCVPESSYINGRAVIPHCSCNLHDYQRQKSTVLRTKGTASE